SVGRAVTRFGVGDQVFGATELKFGTHAEYVCLPENRLLVTKPDNMTFEEAAAILFGGMSALHFLRKAKSMSDRRSSSTERPAVSVSSLFNWRSTSGRTSRACAARPISNS